MKIPELLDCYREMLRIRIAEERIAELQPQQEMRCPIHLCVGQEAVPVGVCRALQPQDNAVGTHRSHGHYLAKGGCLKGMMAELYGKATGCASGVGGSMHLIDLKVNFLGAAPIVACTIPLAVGMAFASAFKKENRVTVAFFGDGATEEGVFYESLNYAALKKLPVLFVCENNFYSTHTPLSDRRPVGCELWEIAKGFGVWSAKGNGNDVAAVYELALKAVSRARSGEGPVFLEFTTYRWLEHCGPYPDHELGYRTKQEVDDWIRKCPVVRLERHLVKDSKVEQSVLDQIRKEVLLEVNTAIQAAHEAPFPEMSHAFANVTGGKIAERVI